MQIKKLLTGTLIVAVALFVLVFFGTSLIAKAAIENGAQFIMGLPLKIKSLDVNFMNTFVSVKDLHLSNPSGFKERTMLQMPEIFVDYDLPSFFKGKIHLEEVRIDLQEFIVTKNEKGEVNLNSLKPVQAQKEQPKKEEKPEEGKKGKAPQIQIDKLSLKVGKVIYKDYSKGGEPSVKEFNINLDEKYENITNPYMIGSLVVTKALAHTTIAALTNIDLSNLSKSVDGALLASKQAAEETVKKAQEGVKQAAKELGQVAANPKEAVQKTTQALSDTTKELKSLTTNLSQKIKIPFRKESE